MKEFQNLNVCFECTCCFKTDDIFYKNNEIITTHRDVAVQYAPLVPQILEEQFPHLSPF